ncbi:MAG: uroporphyrinogen-III C-methyltransferase [Paracoccaceae bacterium]
MVRDIPELPGGWPVFARGLVWLVGAGPGDPGLLTLHGLNALRQADHIVYDALVEERILEWRRPGAEVEYAGKRGGKPSPQQRDITLRLISLARAGKRVLRLKGGDPFVFGRGGEEAQGLVEAGVPIRVTPGITAGIGGLAYAGIPVSHRDVNQAVTFLTGHDRSGALPTALDWEGIARGSQVIVLYMAMKHFDGIAARLIAAGRDPNEPVAAVAEASLANQRVVETVLGRAAADIAEAGIAPPAVIVIGRVVLLRRMLDWAAQLAGEAPRSLDPLGLRAPRACG